MIDRSLNYGRHHIKSFLEQAPNNNRILDIGAGHGTDLQAARNVNPDAALFASENWPPYIKELSDQQIIVNSVNIERDRLPFDDNDLDVVIANQVLEHTKELFFIFHEVSRVLRIGGSFIIGVPNLAAFHNRLLLAMGRQPSPIKSASAHVRGFTKPDMIDFIQNCFHDGYKLTAFGGSNFYPFSPLLARPLASALPNLAWGIFFMFEKQKVYSGEFLDFPVVNKLETNFYLGK